MSTTLHKATERGSVDHGWLQANHSFSFGHYFDPAKMGFGLLRVLNDDRIAPGKGFPKHPHDNMEIITLPLAGALAHKDSMGHEQVIRQGEVQAMSAGTGILHSEYNHLQDQETNILQIWVLPKLRNIEPRYQQKAFSNQDRHNQWQTLVSPDGAEGSVSVNQDVWFSRAEISQGNKLEYSRKKESNGLYVFLIAGEARIAGNNLTARDALGITSKDSVTIEASADTDILLIDVPMKQ